MTPPVASKLTPSSPNATSLVAWNHWDKNWLLQFWLHLGLKEWSLKPPVSSENLKSLVSCNPAGCIWDWTSQLWQVFFGLMALPVLYLSTWLGPNRTIFAIKTEDYFRNVYRTCVLEKRESRQLKLCKHFLNAYCNLIYIQNSFASNNTNPANANMSRMSMTFTFISLFFLLGFFKLSRK